MIDTNLQWFSFTQVRNSESRLADLQNYTTECGENPFRVNTLCCKCSVNRSVSSPPWLLASGAARWASQGVIQQSGEFAQRRIDIELHEKSAGYLPACRDECGKEAPAARSSRFGLQLSLVAHTGLDGTGSGCSVPSFKARNAGCELVSGQRGAPASPAPNRRPAHQNQLTGPAFFPSG